MFLETSSDTDPVTGHDPCLDTFPDTDMTLADMSPAGRCRVLGAAPENRDFQSRLYALGLFPGAIVDILHVAPLGDPLQIRVGHTLLSIRRQEARLVEVEAAS